MRLVGKLLVPAIVAIACAAPGVAAAGAPWTRLGVAFEPMRLGQGTTVEFDIRISRTAADALPLTGIDLLYPRTLGFLASGLGIDTCDRPQLEAQGPRGCPADSRMGQGFALAEIFFGPKVIRETAQVTVFRSSDQAGRIALLFYLAGSSPVVTRQVFSSLLLPGPTPDTESVHISAPLISGFPGSPDVAVQRLHVSIGPRGLMYYERVRGREIAYRPRGILLPASCPRGGFRFAASLGFVNGSRTGTHTSVRCPRRGH